MISPRYKSIKKVLWVILFANFVVAAIKICIGYFCNSQSVMSDGIHSIADGSSNIVGLIGIWLASKPCDSRHPYGHDKFEIIASLFIGVMLAVMAVRIVTVSVSSLLNPMTLNIDYTEIILIIVTILINSVVAATEYSCGKKLNSTILITDSLHTRGDIMISCAVLFGLVGIKLGIPVWIDGIMSLVVAIAVFISAYQIIRNCVDILVDTTTVDSDEVKKLLMTIPGIYDVHQVRSRGEQSHIFIDLHVVVNSEDNIERVHTLSHKLESVLKEHFGFNTEVNIHMEPVGCLSEKY